MGLTIVLTMVAVGQFLYGFRTFGRTMCGHEHIFTRDSYFFVGVRGTIYPILLVLNVVTSMVKTSFGPQLTHYRTYIFTITPLRKATYIITDTHNNTLGNFFFIFTFFGGLFVRVCHLGVV